MQRWRINAAEWVGQRCRFRYPLTQRTGYFKDQWRISTLKPFLLDSDLCDQFIQITANGSHSWKALNAACQNECPHRRQKIAKLSRRIPPFIDEVTVTTEGFDN